MSGELAERLARELVRCREASGHNRLSVEHFSREEAVRRGDEFFVHNTSLLKYEKGSWPSPPKLITLARAYGVPISRFLQAIGADDLEICGHVVGPEDRKLFEIFRDPAFLEWHRKLQVLIESDGPESRAVQSVIEMATLAAAGAGGGTSAAGRDDEARFVVHMADDSMSPELLIGDSLLVDRAEEAKSGDLVSVAYRGERMVRRLLRGDDVIELCAVNREFPEVQVKADDDFEMLGVVVKVLERTLTRPT